MVRSLINFASSSKFVNLTSRSTLLIAFSACSFCKLFSLIDVGFFSRSLLSVYISRVYLYVVSEKLKSLQACYLMLLVYSCLRVSYKRVLIFVAFSKLYNSGFWFSFFLYEPLFYICIWV